VVEEFPQTQSSLTAIGQGLFELVQGRNLVLYPDAGMRLAVSRAVAIETPRGWRISKATASHKVDVVIALAMSCFAAVSIGGAPVRRWAAVSGDGRIYDADNQHPIPSPPQRQIENNNSSLM
jgi:hypothetical protein